MDILGSTLFPHQEFSSSILIKIYASPELCTRVYASPELCTRVYVTEGRCYISWNHVVSYSSKEHLWYMTHLCMVFDIICQKYPRIRFMAEPLAKQLWRSSHDSGQACAERKGSTPIHNKACSTRNRIYDELCRLDVEFESLRKTKSKSSLNLENGVRLWLAPLTYATEGIANACYWEDKTFFCFPMNWRVVFWWPVDIICHYCPNSVQQIEICSIGATRLFAPFGICKLDNPIHFPIAKQKERADLSCTKITKRGLLLTKSSHAQLLGSFSHLWFAMEKSPGYVKSKRRFRCNSWCFPVFSATSQQVICPKYYHDFWLYLVQRLGIIVNNWCCMHDSLQYVGQRLAQNWHSRLCLALHMGMLWVFISDFDV